MGCMLDEHLVKIDHSNESFKALDVNGLAEILDGLDLVRERHDPVFVDSMSEEINF